MQKLNRREWLRKTMGLVAAAAVAPVLELPGVAKAAPAVNKWGTQLHYWYGAPVILDPTYQGKMIELNLRWPKAGPWMLDSDGAAFKVNEPMRHMNSGADSMEKRGVIDDKTPDMPETVKQASDDKLVHRLDKIVEKLETVVAKDKQSDCCGGGKCGSTSG